MEEIQVTVNGRPMSCEAGMTLQELAVQYDEQTDDWPAIVAKVDGVVKELWHSVTEKCFVPIRI